jgi:small subunit ribosomal protein S6
VSLYESIFVGRQDLSTNQVGNIISSLTELIKSDSGSVIKSEYCGLRPLAYPIKKNRKGHYIILSIDCKKQLIEKLKDFFNLNEDIIRDLTISVEKHDEEHSTLYQQSKSFRESRNWDTKNN